MPISETRMRSALRLSPERFLPATDPLVDRSLWALARSLSCGACGRRTLEANLSVSGDRKNIACRFPPLACPVLSCHVLAALAVLAPASAFRPASSCTAPHLAAFAGCGGGLDRIRRPTAESGEIVREAWRVEMTTDPTTGGRRRLRHFRAKPRRRQQKLGFSFRPSGHQQFLTFTWNDRLSGFDRSASTPAYLWIVTEGSGQSGKLTPAVLTPGQSDGRQRCGDDQQLGSHATYHRNGRSISRTPPREAISPIPCREVASVAAPNVAAASPAPRLGLPTLLAGSAVPERNLSPICHSAP